MSAAEHWKSSVERHHEQSLRAMGEAGPPSDFWRSTASGWRADPRRTDDEVLDRLKREVKPDQTVLDVGGAAGRFALALALGCRSVTVAEPSEGMLEQLDQASKEAGIGNVKRVQGNWEDVEVEPADVVLCSHVVYGIADLVPFIRKLASHARDRVLMLSFVNSPQSHLAPFWTPVHGEDRVNLPALPELVNVMWEVGIYPGVEMFGASDRQVFDSREAAVGELRGRLWVAPNTEADRRLQQAAEELLEDCEGGVAIRGAGARRQGLISWRPE